MNYCELLKVDGDGLPIFQNKIFTVYEMAIGYSKVNLSLRMKMVLIYNTVFASI
jgi:hypothetical protein